MVETPAKVPSDSPVLEIRDLNVWFDAPDRHSEEKHVVRGINLTVNAGDRIGLVGESGSGKTTTILAALGLLPSTASVGGQILLDGSDLLARGESTLAPHRWNDIAMVFQGAMSAFNPVRTIGSQIMEAIVTHRGSLQGAPLDRKGVQERVTMLLEQVGLDAGVAGKFPHQLSGGMKQRAMIAMALSCDPKVLLADEPTTALDVVVQDQILKLLVSLSQKLHLALVLVTHDLGVVAQTCTRAAVMLQGQIVEEGTVDDLYRRPQHPYTRQLFESTPNVWDTQKSVADGEGIDGEEQNAAAVHLLEVADIHTVYGAPRRASATSRTRPGALRRASKAVAAVDGVSLTVDEGEFVALVGQSGCGKSTTIQNIMGMLPVQSGTISMDGAVVSGLSQREWRKLRQRVQMIYQDPYESLDSRLTVADTVAEPLTIHRRHGTRAERTALVREALADVGLDPDVYAERYPHELSGGQRQRVAIAASVILRPRLLLADEPVSMLDVSLRTGILELLDRLRREYRMGILMITHDLSTAAAYADRIIVMREGRVVEQGTPWQVVHEPTSDYTQRLISSVPSPDPLAHR